MGIFGSIASGIIGAASSNKAAKAQQGAANDQIALQRKIYKDQTRNFLPFLTSGTDALAALKYDLFGGDAPVFGGTPLAVETIGGEARAGSPGPFQGGFGRDERGNRGAPMSMQEPTRYRVGDRVFDTRADAEAYANANRAGGTTYQGYQASPGYAYQLQAGKDAIQGSAASRGLLHSGATLQGLTEFGQNLADQDRNNYLAQLSSLAGQGQAAAGNQANAGANFAANASNALANYGDARAAGSIGVGNALNNGLGNAFSLWNYQNRQPNTSGIGWSDWGFG